jgi:single-strand DNA-binding protein
MSFNKIIVVGNLGRDPELRYTPQGTPVCHFSVATNERRKGPGGEPQDITTWFKITVWNKQAETVSRYLTKGRMVYVEGRLHVSEWSDKEGKQRQTLEVTASDVKFLDGGQSLEGIPASQAQSAATRLPTTKPSSPDIGVEDEIPF